MLKSKCCGKEVDKYQLSAGQTCRKCGNNCEVVEEPIWDENVSLEGNGQGNYHLVKKPQPPTESWEGMLEFALPDKLSEEEKQTIRNNVSTILSQAEARHKEEKKQMIDDIGECGIYDTIEDEIPSKTPLKINTAILQEALKTKYLKD